MSGGFRLDFEARGRVNLQRNGPLRHLAIVLAAGIGVDIVLDLVVSIYISKQINCRRTLCTHHLNVASRCCRHRCRHCVEPCKFPVKLVEPSLHFQLQLGNH